MPTTPIRSARRAALLLAHGDAPHAGKPGPARAEQTDWSIAGTARPGLRVVTTTSTFTPTDRGNTP